METLLALVIVMGIILFGIPLLAHSYLSSQQQVAQGIQEMEDREREISLTEISLLREQGQDAANVELVLENTGNLKLADYGQWDVIVSYDDSEEPSGHHSVWLPYGQSPSDNHWWVVGIYLDATNRGSEMPEAYEPDIFNPEEEMVIGLRLSPTIGLTTTNMTTIATANGVSASGFFTR